MTPLDHALRLFHAMSPDLRHHLRLLTLHNEGCLTSDLFTKLPDNLSQEFDSVCAVHHQGLGAIMVIRSLNSLLGLLAAGR